MSNERIDQTKSAVEASAHIPANKKPELSAALSKLKPALDRLSKTQPEKAEEVARRIDALTQEAARREKRPGLVENLSRELKESVEKFEASHPEVAAFVLEYSALLSALGV